MQSRFSFTGLYRHVFPRYEYTSNKRISKKTSKDGVSGTIYAQKNDQGYTQGGYCAATKDYEYVMEFVECDDLSTENCVVNHIENTFHCIGSDDEQFVRDPNFGGSRKNLSNARIVSDQELKRYKRRQKRKKYRQRKHLRKLMEDQNLELNVENDYMEREKELCETFMQNMRTNTDNFLDKIPNATDEQLGLLLEQNAFIIQTYNRIRSRLMNEKISRLGNQFEREVLTQSDDEKESTPENVPETIPEETV